MTDYKYLIKTFKIKLYQLRYYLTVNLRFFEILSKEFPR